MTVERFYEQSTAGLRRSAPAVLRNRQPIAEVLAEWLPVGGTILEIASGTGEHAVHFASWFPSLVWQPSDMHESALASISAWREEADLPNLLAPMAIDASAQAWPVDRADAVISINMAHISPWAASLGLLDGAARILPSGGPLIFYGPWFSEQVQTAPSNEAFDQDLKSRNPAWGLRSVEVFAEEAAKRGLILADQRPMPANNLMLLFRRAER